MIIKKSLNVIATYLFAFAIVLECRSIWLFENNSTSRFSTVLLIILTVGAIARLLSMNLSTKRIYNFFPILVSILFTGFIWIVATRYNIVSSLRFFSACIVISTSYFLSDSDSKYKILIAIKNIIFVIACISLFFWFFGSTLHIISANGLIESNWTGTSTYKLVPNYYNFYYEPQKIFVFNNVYVRNSAIFTEAPMASYIFVIALIIELYLNKSQKNRIIIFVLILSILSTTSTTGLLCLVLIMVYKLINSQYTNILIKIIKLIFFPLIFIILLNILLYLINNKINTNSGTIRIDDFVVGFKTWLKAPIFGHGYGNDQALIDNMNWWRTNLGFSNSLTQLLAQGGLFMLGIYLYPIINCFVYYAKLKNFHLCMVIVLFVFLFTFTITTYQYITILFIFMLYDKFSFMAETNILR